MGVRQPPYPLLRSGSLPPTGGRTASRPAAGPCRAPSSPARTHNPKPITQNRERALASEHSFDQMATRRVHFGRGLETSPPLQRAPLGLTRARRFGRRDGSVSEGRRSGCVRGADIRVRKAMPTIEQLVREAGGQSRRRRRPPVWPALPSDAASAPASTRSPPRSPTRLCARCARVRLSRQVEVTAYIPGEGHNLQEHSIVLVRGGRVQRPPRSPLQGDPGHARRRRGQEPQAGPFPLRGEEGGLRCEEAPAQKRKIDPDPVFRERPGQPGDQQGPPRGQEGRRPRHRLRRPRTRRAAQQARTRSTS